MTIEHQHAAIDPLLDRKPSPGRRMTEEEFVAWCDEDTRAEWVDGEVVVHSPTSIRHILSLPPNQVICDQS